MGTDTAKRIMASDIDDFDLSETSRPIRYIVQKLPIIHDMFSMTILVINLLHVLLFLSFCCETRASLKMRLFATTLNTDNSM